MSFLFHQWSMKLNSLETFYMQGRCCTCRCIYDLFPYFSSLYNTKATGDLEKQTHPDCLSNEIIQCKCSTRCSPCRWSPFSILLSEQLTVLSLSYLSLLIYLASSHWIGDCTRWPLMVPSLLKHWFCTGYPHRRTQASRTVFLDHMHFS